MRPSLMRVRLMSFGPLKSIFAEGGEWRELNQGATVATVLQTLLAAGTVAESALRTAAIAVNRDYVTPNHILHDGDEIAILPPVSGGSGPNTQPRVELVRAPIDAAIIEREIKAASDGAVCIFDGIVRDNTRGRPTLHLAYEAYEEMALKQMLELREQALANFAIRDAAIVHRLGRLVVGETSVFIAVASAHRGPAFDACRWLIDTLKKTVPIWKREQFVDGAVWADGEPFPEEIVKLEK